MRYERERVARDSFSENAFSEWVALCAGAGTALRPAVVIVHGGSFMAGSKNDRSVLHPHIYP